MQESDILLLNNYIYLISLSLFYIGILWVMYTDFKYYTIKNNAIYLIIISYFIALPFSASDYREILLNVIVAIVIFLISYFAFYFNKLGGGDVKFIGVTSLWIGHDLIYEFLFIVSLIGGLLAIYKYSKIFYFSIHNNSQISNNKTTKVPYGIAIGGGALICIPKLFQL